MKLKFTINKKYDWQCVESFGFEISKKDFNISYKVLSEPLEWSVISFQDNWDLIGDSFSKYIENKTAYKWFHEEYECVLSNFHHGVSNWGRSNLIVRAWWENPYYSRRITAHELILSHYFSIYRKHYANKFKRTDGQIWALAEISAFALTSLSKDVDLFWPWNNDYYINHNYPHIVELQNSLKEPFLSANTFDEYILAGLNLVEKYPNLNPSGI